MRAFVLVLLLCLFTGPHAASSLALVSEAPAPVTLRVNKKLAIAPAKNLTATIKVLANTANREIDLVLESDTGYHYGTIKQLDEYTGTEEDYSWIVPFEVLGEGHYAVTVGLMRN